MEKIIFITILITAVILPAFVSANGDHNLSLEDVLGKIMGSQNADKASEIDCQKVIDGQFEELGNVVMSIMHPDERQHELMDQMMGGEGSESLKTAHITMGKNYLGCGTGAMGSGMMGGMDMMSMMGNWSNYSGQNLFNNNMMNTMSGWWSWFGWIFMVSIWVLVIVVIFVLIKWLIKK